MNNKKIKSFQKAFALGILAGMRTTAAPLVANLMLRKGDHPSYITGFANKTVTTAILGVMAAGELVADKLPSTGSRIAAGGLIGRCLSGALSGWAICRVEKANALSGALFGLTAALGSSFACYYLRKGLVKKFHLYDPIVGAAEDLLTIGGGVCLINS
jgi:uncharacterized membrane protein